MKRPTDSTTSATSGQADTTSFYLFIHVLTLSSELKYNLKIYMQVSCAT